MPKKQNAFLDNNADTLANYKNRTDILPEYTNADINEILPKALQKANDELLPLEQKANEFLMKVDLNKKRILTTQNITKDEIVDIINALKPAEVPKKINVQDFLKTMDNVENKENFIEHLKTRKDKERLEYLNLVEPTLNNPDITITKLENGILKEKRIKKFHQDKDFFYLLVSKENGKVLLTGLKTSKMNTIFKEFDDFISLETNADIIQSFIRHGSNKGLDYQPNNTTKRLVNANLQDINDISNRILAHLLQNYTGFFMQNLYQT